MPPNKEKSVAELREIAFQVSARLSTDAKVCDQDIGAVIGWMVYFYMDYLSRAMPQAIPVFQDMVETMLHPIKE